MGKVAVIGAIHRGSVVTDLLITATDEPTFIGVVLETVRPSTRDW